MQFKSILTKGKSHLESKENMRSIRNSLNRNKI